MEREVYYIVVALLFASATLSVIFLLAWMTLGRKAYAATWSLGFLAATLQWACKLAADVFPNTASYWLTMSAFAIALITLGLRGHCQRTECQHLPNNLWPYATTVMLVVVWATVISPHAGVRMAVVPLVAAITLFMSARMIIGYRSETRPAEWGAAISILLFACIQTIAAGMSISHGAVIEADHAANLEQFLFLTLPAGTIATGMFIILMLASDLSEDMKELAIRDQLTAVFDRRGLAESGAAAYATARRTNTELSVVMTDIDRFKRINDRFGHAIGDEALCHFAELLKRARRRNDILARVGGEEFALVLPATGLADALAVADQLCRTIEESPLIVEDEAMPMTASFGVATLNDKDTCLSDTIIRADRALYRSKRAGRNQVDLESSQMMRAADGTLRPISA